MTTPSALAGLPAALGGALFLGALSAFGDWLWTNYLTDGAILPGVIHGAVIFLALAIVLSQGAGPAATRRLCLTLPIAGIVIAAAFYPIAYGIGYLPALVVSWVAMWLLTALLMRRARAGVETFGRIAARGLAAALFSGLAFWAIAGIWTSPSPGGPNYAWHFACWTFAFFPGLAALLWALPPAKD